VALVPNFSGFTAFFPPATTYSLIPSFTKGAWGATPNSRGKLVSFSKANIQGTEADVTRWAAAVDQARADVSNAEQGVSRAQAEWTYSNNNLHRIEPLLVKFVTVDQVDRARTSEIAQAQALKQAESQLRLAQAGLQSTLAQEERSRAMLQQSTAQHEQSQNAVTTLEPLVNQRGARASAIEKLPGTISTTAAYMRRLQPGLPI
jgi:membrane fusion protein, multidrug efflux system